MKQKAFNDDYNQNWITLIFRVQLKIKIEYN